MGRRGHGEGTVYQRKDGRWTAAITLEDRKRKTFYGKTRNEALLSRRGDLHGKKMHKWHKWPKFVRSVVISLKDSWCPFRIDGQQRRLGYLLVVEHESWAFCFGEVCAFAVNFAVLGLFVVYTEVLSPGLVGVCGGVSLES